MCCFSASDACTATRSRDRPDGYGQARCIVLTPSNADLSPLLTKPLNGLGMNKQGETSVYGDVRILEATRRLIHENPEWRIPEMNRSLVERTTHPTALEAIVVKLGDDWRIHANNVEGELIADTMTAGGVIVRRDKTFYEDNSDVVFGDMQQQIRTRLGDEGIEVEFVPPPKSPFDASVSIEKLTIPAHLLRGQSLDAAVSEEPIAPDTDADGFRFSINGAKFHYDRLGLRRVGVGKYARRRGECRPSLRQNPAWAGEIAYDDPNRHAKGSIPNLWGCSVG